MNRQQEIPYSVRRSSRARRIRLTVNARDGLVVVVPQRWRGDVAPIVESKRDWAERALSRVAERRALILAGPDALLPSTIELRAVGEVLPVEYRDTPSRTATARRAGPIVSVTGRVDDAALTLQALRRWLTREARDLLPARLEELAASMNVVPASVRVGSARTRWGSCSAPGVIMLSRNLLFLPSHLADAVMLHELAHLRVLDHSPRFWALLASYDPHAMEHRAQLKQACGFVPEWTDA